MLLMFLRAKCDGTFVLYIQSLDKLVHWLFAFDQTNYAKWLHINIRDPNMFFQVHPGVHG